MEYFAVFSSLIAFIVSFLFGKQIKAVGAEFLTCAGVLTGAVCSVILFYQVDLNHENFTTVLATWITSGDLDIKWTLRVDQLAVVMMCTINLVSSCVHIYSIGYMHDDPHRTRFMAYLSLFTFAMLILVTSNNLLQLFFGWEGVGLASYLLIGFWNKKDSANKAAIKAFIVNRVGDFGLALGIFTCYVVFGSIDFDTIFAAAPSKVNTTVTFLGFQFPALMVICLLLFTGAVGKSAQLGLHTWLPDAMEGPTPVSALIHAATMVTAGVFLVVRFSPVFEYAPNALIIVSVFGALTAFVAATIGMTQFDVKRVIAYSTMSQLGYMFFAVGVSAYGAAMFLLVTHAFFKALLFLGAGSIIHAMGGEQDMRKMGGIYKQIPLTYILMWIGSLALAGMPPLAGFYSKDIVLEAIWMSNTAWANFAFWMVTLAAFQTAFYSWRLINMVFHGKPRADHHTMEHIHESPLSMMAPMIFLALGAVFSGMLLYDSFVGGGHETNSILHWFSKDLSEHWSKEAFWQHSIFVLPQHDTIEQAHNAPWLIKRLPVIVGGLGILFAYIMYMWDTGLPERMKRTFPILYKLFYNKWFFDEIYNIVFVQNSLRLGRLFSKGDRRVIDRFGPDGGAAISYVTAKGLSRFQTGYIYQYAFVMMIALVGILSWFFFRAGLS